MKIVVIGAGPAGLYFATSMKLRDPSHEITVYERNRPDDTFGWGVVFSDQTMDNLRANDLPSAEEILANFAHWDDIDVHFRGETIASGGHGFCGIARMRLLQILQERARELGVRLQFETEIDALDRFADADLIVGADGINSRVRTLLAERFKPSFDVRKNKFIWLGTHQIFDAFTFAFEQTEHGWIWAHAYRFDKDTSTFIVECSPETWCGLGLDTPDQAESIAICERIFAKYLGGHKLMSNAKHLRGSAWINFPRITCEKWHCVRAAENISHPQPPPSLTNQSEGWGSENETREPTPTSQSEGWGSEMASRANPLAPPHSHPPTLSIVLLGDAAHTAHFSIGSGTKLALEDAISLADVLHSTGFETREEALTAYEEARRVEVLKLQSAARNSTEWFENVPRYARLAPMQFAYSLLTRSQRVSHENLRLRDKAWLEGMERWFASEASNDEVQQAVPPMFTPYRLRGLELQNRIVVSPMATYSAKDGMPNDFHLVHYGARAQGGAALLFTEMTCVTAQGRISPGCAGIYTDEQMLAWKRIVDFVREYTDAKFAMQLGHSGPKGSTKLGWEGSDEPLEEGNWEVIGPSPVPWSPQNQIPREVTREDMDHVREAFVEAAKRAEQAGFDMLELHCAHGYLLSAFITPLTNRRTDEYGGSLENRLRYPLEVFKAIRKVWPEKKPISVRISATDWIPEDSASLHPRGAEAIPQGAAVEPRNETLQSSASGAADMIPTRDSTLETRHSTSITAHDAVQIAQAFKDAGADLINVSAGQTSVRAKPVYGRMFQTPFSDRIRNEVGIPTMAVGNIYEIDHVNSILAAGRADLCCMARPHLADPYWTLHAAAKQGYAEIEWPPQYLPGRNQLIRNLQREQNLS